jgi:hypothetical protein
MGAHGADSWGSHTQCTHTHTHTHTYAPVLTCAEASLHINMLFLVGSCHTLTPEPMNVTSGDVVGFK